MIEIFFNALIIKKDVKEVVFIENRNSRFQDSKKKPITSIWVCSDT